MEESTSGWFTIGSDGTMSVWEGVCMLKLNQAICLFKIRNKKLFNIKVLNDNVKQVSSDGYWYCVEFSGCLGKAGWSFYYHADSTENARQMLKHLTALGSTDISTLAIRLDPDPLRCLSLENITHRIAMWSQLGKEFCSTCRVVLDSEMPL